jgi:hypothetical protein
VDDSEEEEEEAGNITKGRQREGETLEQGSTSLSGLNHTVAAGARNDYGHKHIVTGRVRRGEQVKQTWYTLICRCQRQTG